MRQHRPIRRQDVKKLSIIRNPGTGPLIERLRQRPMEGPIGFHSAARRIAAEYNHGPDEDTND